MGDIPPDAQLGKPKWSSFAGCLAQVRLLARTPNGRHDPLRAIKMSPPNGCFHQDLTSAPSMPPVLKAPGTGARDGAMADP